jgi:hypothetical protein
LTPAELLRSWEEYLELLLRHRRDDGDSGGTPPEDARRVLVRFLAFPDVD